MTALLLLALLGLQRSDATAGMKCSTSPGEVRMGEHFVREVAAGLYFHLMPQNSDSVINGWVINIAPSPLRDDTRDYSGPVTPPYRFDNPRNLDTSYGKPASMWTTGSVAGGSFVTTEADWKRARALVSRLLAPAGEFDKALADLHGVRVGTIEVRILNSRTTAPSLEHEMGTIDYLAFELTACLPK